MFVTYPAAYTISNSSDEHVLSTAVLVAGIVAVILNGVIPREVMMEVEELGVEGSNMGSTIAPTTWIIKTRRPIIAFL